MKAKTKAKVKAKPKAKTKPKAQTKPKAKPAAKAPEVEPQGDVASVLSPVGSGSASDLRLSPNSDAAAAAAAAAALDKDTSPVSPKKSKPKADPKAPEVASPDLCGLFSAEGLGTVTELLNEKWRADKSVWAMSDLERKMLVEAVGPALDKYFSLVGPYAVEATAVVGLVVYAGPRLMKFVQARQSQAAKVDQADHSPVTTSPASAPPVDDRLHRWNGDGRA